jgi:hypothetical protein
MQKTEIRQSKYCAHCRPLPFYRCDHIVSEWSAKWRLRKRKVNRVVFLYAINHQATDAIWR